MKIKNRILALAATLTLGLSGTASALVLTADVAGVPSCDGFGAGCNVVATIDLGALVGGTPVEFTALGWDLTIDTIGGSWLSEAVISFSDTGGELFTLTAGVGDSFPGTMFYSSGGLVDLAGALGAYPILNDGLLTVEFFESFDDVSGTPDAFYIEPSTLTLDFSLVESMDVPEPGILALLGLGLLGMIGARRRRV